MSDMLATGLAWLNEQLTDKVSTAWTYRRGGADGDSCTVYLTEERQKLRVSDSMGKTKIERPDLAGTFSADELILGDDSTVSTPLDGDTLERDFDGTTKTFRLNPPNNGNEPAWHYTDPQQNRIRVYAKFIRSAPTE